MGKYDALQVANIAALTGDVVGSLQSHDGGFPQHHIGRQVGDGAPGGSVRHPVRLAQQIHWAGE